jgi:hypothetical protein
VTHSVFHRLYGIELNLTEEHFGHPDRPGLVDELYRQYRADALYCLDAYEHGGYACPGFMSLRKRDGRFSAYHVVHGERQETQSESDLHKALKDYTAETADRQGFAVQVEDRAKHGKRRTDVVITGAEGRKLGYEIQLSAIPKGSVDKRTSIALADGLTPLWLVNNDNAIPIDRAPWARLNVFNWKDVRRRDALPVRGGVKTLRMIPCDGSNPSPCPRTGRGRCGGRHAAWEPTLGLNYDDVIRQTAAGELVPLFMERSDGRRRWYLWVTPNDKERFLQGRPERLLAQTHGQVAAREERRLTPRERDPVCHYQEGAWIRAELSRPRDSGDPIDASSWLSDPDPPDQEIDGFLVPGDLIATQRAFRQTETRCEQIGATHPRAVDIAAGLARITDEQRAELAGARQERLQLVEALQNHPWWGDINNRYLAQLALYAATTE